MSTTMTASFSRLADPLSILIELIEQSQARRNREGLGGCSPTPLQIFANLYFGSIEK